jgi:threonine dehydrogenase-like Zn-dependent dehydrogenase
VITRKEVDVRGGRTSVREFEEAINLIYSGKIAVNRILTQVIAFQEIPHLIRKIGKHPGSYLKVNAVL